MGNRGEVECRLSFELCASLGTSLLWQEAGNKPDEAQSWA